MDKRSVYDATQTMSLRIGGVNEWAMSENPNERSSSPLNIGGMSYRILAMIKCKEGDKRFLAFFVAIDFADENENKSKEKWSLDTEITYRAVSHSLEEDDRTRTSPHTFDQDNNTWGYSRFLPVEKLSAYCDKSGSVFLEAEVRIKMAQLHAMRLARDWQRALMVPNETLSDCCILTGNRHFYVHKAVLAARSPHFAELFSEDRERNEITLHEDCASVEQILKYMYTGKCDVETSAAKLLKLADTYRLEMLKAHCEMTLLASINVQNACELLTMAAEGNARLLREKTISYIGSNMDAFINTPAFENLNNQLLCELFKWYRSNRGRSCIGTK